MLLSDRVGQAVNDLRNEEARIAASHLIKNPSLALFVCNIGLPCWQGDAHGMWRVGWYGLAKSLVPG